MGETTSTSVACKHAFHPLRLLLDHSGLRVLATVDNPFVHNHQQTVHRLCLGVPVMDGGTESHSFPHLLCIPQTRPLNQLMLLLQLLIPRSIAILIYLT